MDLNIEILAGDSKRRVFNWIHSEACETEVSWQEPSDTYSCCFVMWPRPQIEIVLPTFWLLCQTDILCSCPYTKRKCLVSKFNSADASVKYTSHVFYWKPLHHIRCISLLSTSRLLTLAHTEPTAVQQYTHSQHTDSKLLLSFPHHALPSFSATCKTNCAGNFTTNYPVSAKSPQERRKSKPCISLPPQAQTSASLTQMISTVFWLIIRTFIYEIHETLPCRHLTEF